MPLGHLGRRTFTLDWASERSLRFEIIHFVWFTKGTHVVSALAQLLRRENLTELALESWLVVARVVNPIMSEAKFLLQVVNHQSVSLLVFEELSAANHKLLVINWFLFRSQLFLHKRINSTAILGSLWLRLAL